MIELLKHMFKAYPAKATIVLTEKCSDCEHETAIEITPTSSGFGLQGGVLFKCKPDGYFAKCAACYEANSKTDDKSKKQKK